MVHVGICTIRLCNILALISAALSHAFHFVCGRTRLGLGKESHLAVRVWTWVDSRLESGEWTARDNAFLIPFELCHGVHMYYAHEESHSLS